MHLSVTQQILTYVPFIGKPMPSFAEPCSVEKTNAHLFPSMEL